MVWMLALGTVALAVWVVVRIARPSVLRLARAPGRANSLNVLHLLAVFLLGNLAGAVAAQATTRAVGAPSAPAPATQASVAGAEAGMWPAPAGYFALAAGEAFAQRVKHKIKTVAGIVSAAVTIAASLTVGVFAFSRGLRRGMGLSARRVVWDLARAAAALLIVFPLCWGAMYVMALLIEKGLPVPEKPHPLLVFLLTAPAGWKAVIIFAAVVMAPLSEELFYRGLLQSLLRRYVPNPWWAIGIASAVFATSHLGLYRDWPALLILAVVLGYNYERTGRLIAPIALHGLFNATMIAITLSRAHGA